MFLARTRNPYGYLPTCSAILSLRAPMSLVLCLLPFKAAAVYLHYDKLRATSDVCAALSCRRAHPNWRLHRRRPLFELRWMYCSFSMSTPPFHTHADIELRTRRANCDSCEYQINASTTLLELSAVSVVVLQSNSPFRRKTVSNSAFNKLYL